MKISSLSINGVLTLDLHSLNNEGGEGNQTLTRQVVIVDKEGNVQTVNAISGDMFKHIQSEHVYNIALGDNLSLCKSCITFNANRISGDVEFTNKIKGNDKEPKYSDEKVLDEVINKCVIDDLEGILITNDGRNLPRKSCIEFGWIVGLPNEVRTENYFHVKLVPNSSKKENVSQEDSSNSGQNIFYRPANSGKYATICNLDIYRIGYNDIERKYAIDDIERNKRYKALLKSILYTFIKPTGAMRNTQNPHIVDFNGIVTISTNTIPAPTISPLNTKYVEEIESIINSLNCIEAKIEDKSILSYRFDSLAEFSSIFSELINNSEPYRLEKNKN